ncbi:hypothetical protein FRX31_033562 [Thalictrum thalictroides]|uniref:Uncharacterized protein n=1 Tax=Thalictrum thalictroides TaxID=46969 RepID=A0A7J6UXE0_THATH|nr:hypothetical protein FRX31_033562 [Thalictrum thalictroides]
MEAVNHAANMRHLWNIISDKQTLWVQWGKLNLTRERNIWKIKTPPDCSWSWRSILKERNKATTIAIHCIGDGQRTKFWLDPWLGTGTLQDQFLEVHDSLCNKNVRVASMITNGRWTFPKHIRVHIQEIARQAEEYIQIGGGADEVVWTPSMHGEFNLKDTYEAIRKT